MIFAYIIMSNLMQLPCSYEGGFKKARTDIGAGSYGYNLDQSCFAEPDLSKSDFKKGYDSGRANASKLDTAGVAENPKDESSLQNLLKLAAQKEAEASQRAEIEALRQQVQKQNQSLNLLETETSNLKNETSRLKEDLARKADESKSAK